MPSGLRRVYFLKNAETLMLPFKSFKGRITSCSVPLGMQVVETTLKEVSDNTHGRNIDLIRVSSGTAVILGLDRGFLDAEPTTAYLLTFRKAKCTANCGFCPQARSSSGRADMLSRVSWPVFAAGRVIPKLVASACSGKIGRICIQALNYPTVLEDLLVWIRKIKSAGSKVPISVACQPLNKWKMEKLAEAGVERAGIPLDAATKEVFDRVKGLGVDGPYDWQRQHEALLNAVEVFGRGQVSTHLIVGLGERDKDIIERIQWCTNNGILPALFSFTPIPGTALEQFPQPPISRYRRVQLGRHLIVKGKTTLENMDFDENGCVISFGVSEKCLRSTVRSGLPFLTSGCPSCNRPYYNEKPSGPMYNFPKPPTPQQIKEIERDIKGKQ